MGEFWRKGGEFGNFGERSVKNTISIPYWNLDEIGIEVLYGFSSNIRDEISMGAACTKLDLELLLETPAHLPRCEVDFLPWLFSR